MTTYTITVPKIGKYMNANDRPHYRERAKATKLWREAGRIATLAAKVPALTPPVHITATVHIADRKRREVSNLAPTMKAAIDGMVDAGILADDSDAHVIGPDPRRGFGKVPQIVFRLEEVAGNPPSGIRLPPGVEWRDLPEAEPVAPHNQHIEAAS